MANDDLDFYAAIPVFDSFADVTKPSSYRPLPEDWMIGFSDVVGSTKAIAEGRYKAVNMVGAGVIAAVANALARRPFAFVFGGDGASFAVSPEDAPLATEALKAMAVFSREELQMELRVAMVPVAAVRAAGRLRSAITFAMVKVLPEPVTPSSTWSFSPACMPETSSEIARGWSPWGL